MNLDTSTQQTQPKICTAFAICVKIGGNEEAIRDRLNVYVFMSHTVCSSVEGFISRVYTTHKLTQTFFFIFIALKYFVTSGG